MMEKKLYDMAKAMEDAVDDELHRMNNMDEEDLGTSVASDSRR